MRRGRVTAVLVAVLVLAVAGIGVVAVGSGLVPSPFRSTSPERSKTGPQYANAALTPEESTVLAQPQPDGTLKVTQTLVFDAGTGSTRPVRWAVGGERVGWESAARKAQLGVVPRVSEVTAYEVDAQRRHHDLRVDRDDSRVKDQFLDRVVFSFAAPEGWGEGRHAVQIAYRLADVYVQLDGQPMAVLPMTFAGGPESDGQSLTLTRVRVAGAPTLRCLAGNASVDEQQPCREAVAGRISFHGSMFDYTSSAVGILAPAGVTAPPGQPVRIER